MAELTKDELKAGKKQLEGVLIFCWVMAIILGLAIFSGNIWTPFGLLGDYLEAPFTLGAAADLARGFIGFPFRMLYSLIAPALFIAELIGIYQRKAFAVPLGRAVLVVSMVFLFPVGTIIGAILWKRFNHQMSKKYLNYED